jgi:hypothetical protein
MQHKLYKTHRKRSYYQLRKLSSFSLTLALAFVAIVVPLTLNVGASTTLDSSTVSSQSSSETVPTSTPSQEIENVEIPENIPLIITTRRER